jgi:hypothetical protein
MGSNTLHFFDKFRVLWINQIPQEVDTARLSPEMVVNNLGTQLESGDKSNSELSGSVRGLR